MDEEEQVLEPTVEVDLAIDTILECIQKLDAALPQISMETIPQNAALDAAKDAYENGVKPYLADFIKLWDMLDEK